MAYLNRRKFVTGAAGVVLGSLAGCTGGGNGGEEGGDEGAGGNGEEDTTGDTDGGGNQTSGGEDGDSTDGTAGDGGVEEVIFRDAVQMGESFAFESEFENGAKGTATGRYYEGDRYSRIETEDQTVEIYEVDDVTYVVFVDESMCVKNPGEAMKPENGGAETESYESDVEEYPEITPKGTTTIDGETVYIFEVSSEDTETVTTYYVSVETGHLRRVETETSVTDLSSWGDVDPIQPPDMECRDVSEMPQAPGDF